MEKKYLAAALAAVALMLAACDSPSQPAPNGPPPVIQPDKDCQHPDGKPC